MINPLDIKSKVIEMGACDYAPSRLRAGMSTGDLIKLMLNPRCLEFCMNHKYPTMDMLTPYESQLADNNVFISGKHKVGGSGKYIIFGGDVSIKLSGHDVADIYICGGSVLVHSQDNSIAFIEDWGGLVMHESFDESDINIFKK